MRLKKIMASGRLLSEQVLRALFNDVNFNFEKLETLPVHVSSSQTIAMNRAHKVVWANSTSGVVTLTLPPARECFGQFVSIRRSAGGNNVVVQADGTDTINGASSLTLAALYASCTLISDGDLSWGVL